MSADGIVAHKVAVVVVVVGATLRAHFWKKDCILLERPDSIRWDLLLLLLLCGTTTPRGTAEHKGEIVVNTPETHQSPPQWVVVALDIRQTLRRQGRGMPSPARNACHDNETSDSQVRVGSLALNVSMCINARRLYKGVECEMCHGMPSGQRTGIVSTNNALFD